MAIDINYSDDMITSTINGVEIVSALINAYNEANGAFNRANNITGIPYVDTITATGGVAVNSGSYLSVSGNGTFALTANASSTTQVGVVQLNDTITSTSTTLAATANAVNTAWSYANAAFLEANSFQSIINSAFSSYNAFTTTANAIFVNLPGDAMTGTLTVPNLGVNTEIWVGTIAANNNVSAANLNTTGVVNSQILSVTSITGNNSLTPTVGYYNLSLRESGQIMSFSNTSTLNVNIGIGSTSTLPVGYRTVFLQANTGNVIFKANGCNLFSRIGVNMETLGQYGMATLFCYSANNFILSGEIS
jgi:hypothetical protein